MGINRNIVECKGYQDTRISEEGDMRINRNIVECKGKNRFELCVSFIVLIETQWNVKEETVRQPATAAKRVLIETQWNVKTATDVATAKTAMY